MNYDIVIVGGGSAGLAAAKSAFDPQLKILMIEKEAQLGGILFQCIHNGFGLSTYQEELTGPEYAARSILEVDSQVEIKLSTTVLDIIHRQTFILKISSAQTGFQTIESKAVIITSGCYERTRGMIEIPGDRPKGIMPAGSAQRYMNIEGHLVGKNIFILGSGDIGLIMARRMTLEGAKVHGVAEIMPYSNGLNRNLVQCLYDFDIPLYLSHALVDIKGHDVLEEITIQQVDQNFVPMEGTKKVFPVDTLLLSVGLIPDLAMFDSLKLELDTRTKSAMVSQDYQSSIPGLFIAGNALHVHDLVDNVTKEGLEAGKAALNYLKSSQRFNAASIHVQFDNPIRYVIPQMIQYEQLEDTIEFKLRVTRRLDLAIFKFYQQDQLIHSIKARHLAPSEMVHLSLKTSLIQKNLPIHIRLEEVKL